MSLEGICAWEWAAYIQAADEAAGQGGAEARGLASEAAGAFLAADSGSQDGERDHEHDDRDEGYAGKDDFHGT